MGEGLKQRVLILNRLWQAVNIVGVHRAFSLLMQDHAQVIHTRDGSFRLLGGADWLALSRDEPPEEGEAVVATVQRNIRVPKVLLLRRYDRLPVQEVKFTRENLFERDRYRCQYCGNAYDARHLNLDHVIPRDKGGRTSWENIVTSCVKCNSRKANRLPHQANMRLIRKPERPRMRPFVSTLVDGDCDADWATFVQMKNAPAASG